MLKFRGVVAGAAALGLLLTGGLAGTSRAAIIAGQLDNFEDGTLQSWQNGAPANPNPATNITSGGPTGVNDNFLRLTSNGGSAGGKLVVFNTDQWAGNYVAAGVNSIQMQVNNLGNTALDLRLVLNDTTHAQSLGTLAHVNVPAGSGWNTVSFSLAPANLTGGDYATVMQSVTDLSLAHSPVPITIRSSSPNLVAQLGVDNMTAVPEPGAVWLAAAGLVATALAGRGRRGMV
jgi:hypothetical protein